MAATRKLQAEIDRTLKKVQEGVELFDEIWEKVYNAQNANQKEKFEAELKSQIKKLQRYRDDIKTWITNSDIKDKRPLTDARKLIETEMERFKVCEKEFKTKAFSKEGLSQATKEDPKEKERNKVRKWISQSLEAITEAKDIYEAEIESASSSKKSKKGKDSPSKFEELLERCKFHEEKLEVVLRLIDNESLSPTVHAASASSPGTDAHMHTRTCTSLPRPRSRSPHSCRLPPPACVLAAAATTPLAPPRKDARGRPSSALHGSGPAACGRGSPWLLRGPWRHSHGGLLWWRAPAHGPLIRSCLLKTAQLRCPAPRARTHAPPSPHPLTACARAPPLTALPPRSPRPARARCRTWSPCRTSSTTCSSR